MLKKEIPLEIGHVLFIDIVGYSKLLTHEQRTVRDTLNQIVRQTEQVRRADAAGTLIKSPSGDGMALIFRGSPEDPVECALEISRALKAQPNLRLRMGIHSGPASGVVDVNNQTGVAGAGINMAQRVMDCGDAGHILISKHVAEDLEHDAYWKPQLHDLGEYEVKHGGRVHIVNLYTEELGNPEVPEKIRQTKETATAAAVPVADGEIQRSATENASAQQRAGDLQGAVAFRMHPLTLAFEGRLEREFITDYHRTCIKTARFGLLLALLLYCGFGLLDPWMVPEVLRRVQLIRFGIVSPIILLMVLLSYTAAFERVMEVLLNLCVVICGFGIIAIVMVAPPPGRYFYYAGLLLCATGAYTLFRVRFVYATFDLAMLFVAYEISAIWITPTPVPILLNNSFFFVSATIIGMSAGYYIELYTRRDFVRKKLLRREQEKSETLLLNILPAEIVRRLKEEGDQYTIHSSRMIVDRFPEVTILFADIVGFTELASRVSPEALVVFLNEVFSKFDALADRFGLEKIKTIGDAYMAVSGLLVRRTDHAKAGAEMALEMQSALNEFDAAKDGWLQMRIGLHTGPVVAGVIGTKKFSYDLWGNAVNVASRMERSSLPGKILVSEATYNRLRNHYHFAECVELEIKGKGRMKTYFLLGKSSNQRPTDQRIPSPTVPASLGLNTDEAN